VPFNSIDIIKGEAALAIGLNEMAYVAFGEAGDGDIDNLPDAGSAEFSSRMAYRRIGALNKSGKAPVVAIEELLLDFPTPHRRDRDSRVSFVTFWDGNGDIVVVMIDRGKMSPEKNDGNGGCGNICGFWVVEKGEVEYGDGMEEEVPSQAFIKTPGDPNPHYREGGGDNSAGGNEEASDDIEESDGGINY
jgi:hypothetical protein